MFNLWLLQYKIVYFLKKLVVFIFQHFYTVCGLFENNTKIHAIFYCHLHGLYTNYINIKIPVCNIRQPLKFFNLWYFKVTKKKYLDFIAILKNYVISRSGRKFCVGSCTRFSAYFPTNSISFYVCYHFTLVVTAPDATQYSIIILTMHHFKSM